MDSNITRKLGKMKLVAESLNEFERGRGVKPTLDIGMDAQLANLYKASGYEMPGSSNRYRVREPLWIASRAGHTDLVKYLLAKGSDVHANDDAALRWAAGKGHEEVVKILLDAGANPHAQGTLSYWQKRSYPGEAFAWASREGHYDVVDALKQAEQGAVFFPKAKPETEKLVRDKIGSVPEVPEPEEVQEPAEAEEENKGWI